MKCELLQGAPFVVLPTPSLPLTHLDVITLPFSSSAVFFLREDSFLAALPGSRSASKNAGSVWPGFCRQGFVFYRGEGVFLERVPSSASLLHTEILLHIQHSLVDLNAGAVMGLWALRSGESQLVCHSLTN